MTSYISPIPIFKPTMRFVSMFDDPPPLISHNEEKIAQQIVYPFLPKSNVPIVVNPSVLVPSRIVSNAPFAPSYPPSMPKASFAPSYHLSNNSLNTSFGPSYPFSNNSPNGSFSTGYPSSNNSPNSSFSSTYPSSNNSPNSSFSTTYPSSNNSPNTSFSSSNNSPNSSFLNTYCLSNNTFPFNDNISSATRRGLFSPVIPSYSKQELLDLCEKYELSKVGNKKKILKRLYRKGVFAKEAGVENKKLTWSQNSRNRELIEACRTRKLSVYGTKDELLQRLRDDEELRIEKRIKGMAAPQEDRTPGKSMPLIFGPMPTHSNEIQNKSTDEATLKTYGATDISYNKMPVVERKLFPESAIESREVANLKDDKNNGDSENKTEQYGSVFNEGDDSNKNSDDDDEDKLVIDEDEVETYGGIFNEDQQSINMNDNILNSQGDEDMDEGSLNNSADNEDHSEENVKASEGTREANEEMAELEESDLPEENYYSGDNVEETGNNFTSENDDDPDDPGMPENGELFQDEEIELPDNEEELVYVSKTNKPEAPEEEPTEDIKDNKSTFFAWGSFLGSGGTSEKVKFIS